MNLKSRDILKKTVIKEASVKLVLPGTDYNMTSKYEELAEKIEKHSGAFEVLENPEAVIIEKAAGPVVLIGNLADSLCVEKLYYEFLSVTDMWYPGPSGYEIRTLINPFGNGYNIIHIGYSDGSGLSEALDMIIKRIDEEIPYTCDIHPSRLHIPDGYANHIATDVLDAGTDTFYYSIRPENKGYLAYMTGNKSVLEDYIKAMTEMLEMPKQHLMLYNRFTIWRLLEVSGMLTDEIAGRYPEFFLEWVRGDEGIGSIDKHRYQSPYLARNNHGTIPALGIKMFSRYLKTYHSDLYEANEYEKLADNVYAPYFTGSWKPQCDGLCHGWWLSQPVLLHYALIDPDKKYFVNGGARKAADCAVAVINNKGWMPSAGDANMSRQHPGFSLRIAAAYYKDGRYKFANDIAPFEYSNCGEMSAMIRQFDIGLVPVKPDDKILTIIPMDELIYETWNHENEDYSKTISDTPPKSSRDKCFDKITFRAGWNENDEYMIVDGLGGGGHSYSDAGAVLEYSAFGIPFLVSEDRLSYVEPENHNMITISRNGMREPIPAFPIMEEHREYDDGTAYVRILSPDNNGADWVREIYFIPGIGAAFRDYITANKNGDYSLEAHFRTPGSVMPKEDGYVCLRENDKKEKVAFILTGFNDEETIINFTEQSYSHLFRTPPGKNNTEHDGLDNRLLFQKRYRTNRLTVTAYKAKKNIKMKAGESVEFTHFITAGDADERPVSVKKIFEGLTVEKGEKLKVLEFKNKAEEKEIDDDVNEVKMDFFADLVYESGAEFISMVRTENGYAAGTASGDIYLFNEDEELIWQAKEEGPVYALCMEDGFIYAGVGQNKIVSYRNGYRIWIHEYKRIPTMYYWWELETPRIVTIKAEKGLIFAGCGDNHLRCFNSDGEELWAYYYRASVPGLFDIVDIDGDGNKEIIISGGVLSAYSQIEIIDFDGKLKYTPTPSIGAGWTSYTSALKVIEYWGEKYILQGVNRNENLVLMKFTGTDEKRSFEKIFSFALAGAVTSLYEEKGMIYVGTSLGFLSAYDMMGDRKWMVSMNGGIRYIAGAGEGLFIVEADGTMYRVSKEGEILLISMDSMRSGNIIEDNEKFLFIQGKGVYKVKKEETNDEL